MSNCHLIYIATLIRKDILGEVTLEEKRQLGDWLDESARHRELFDKCNNPDFLASVDIKKDMEKAQETYSNFMQRLRPTKPVCRITWDRYVAAITLIAFLRASAIFVYMCDGGKLHSPSGLATVPVQQMDTIPAGSTDILLITASEEEISVQSSQKMLSMSSGTLKIDEQPIEEYAQVKTVFAEVVYNTLKILRGKRFKMQLSDGTLVWLNADSEIIFPGNFDGKERKVLAKGELFFDVTEDKSQPFIVEALTGDARVLGTAFSIHCYEDEVPMVTLVRGKVAYSLRKESVILAPGQQYRVEDNKLPVKETDAYGYVSWIDEVLVFKDKELDEVPSALSRLYNIDIYYENPELKRLLFAGSFEQYEHLDRIIRMIEDCGLIHIKQDRRTLTVSE